MRWPAILLWAILPWALSSGAARAEGWTHRSLLQMRSNRPGFGLLTYTGWRTRLYESTHPLLSGNYVEAGAVAQISPASLHLGAYLEAALSAPLLLRLTAQRLRFFGNFGPMSTFPSPHARWDERTLDRLQRRGGRYGAGVNLEGLAMLRLKLGPLLALVEERMQYLNADVPKGRGWYEPISDLIVGQEDGLHSTKVSLLGLVYGSPVGASFLALGVRWERYATVVSAVRRQIAGGMVLWRPGWWAVGRTTFAGLLGVLPADRYRRWEPYLGGAVIVQLGVGR